MLILMFSEAFHAFRFDARADFILGADIAAGMDHGGRLQLHESKEQGHSRTRDAPTRAVLNSACDPRFGPNVGA